MKRFFRGIVYVFAAAAPACWANADPAPAKPFPQHLTYAAGSIFPSHRTQAQLDRDVRNAYRRWKDHYLAQAGTEPGGAPRYRVLFSRDANDATVSEGQGYGMVIVPLMAGYDSKAREIFDGLWFYFDDHRSAIDRRLMDWHVPEDESSEGDDDDSAFDGDADIALGLLMADAQWGSGGAIDYRAEAEQVIKGILKSEIGQDSNLPMLGDWVSQNGAHFNQYTPRSSDFMLANFRAFGAATGKARWSNVVTACQNAAISIQSNFSATTGLLPDFLVPASQVNHALQPAAPFHLESETDGDYSYNAGRDPWRIGVDALLFNDASSREIARKMSLWIADKTHGKPKRIRAGYALDGQPLADSGYFTTFFAAPFGVAAMLEPAQQDWLNAIYDSVRKSDEDYYEDTVTLLCMFVMTRNYWVP